MGETHWNKACLIRSQILLNQRRKKESIASKQQESHGDANARQSGTGNKSTKRSLVNTNISVPRRNQLRSVKKRKKSRSPSSSEDGSASSSEDGSAENSDSYQTSTSSVTMSGNDGTGSRNGSSTSSMAQSTNPSTSENDNTPRKSSSCSCGDER